MGYKKQKEELNKQSEYQRQQLEIQREQTAVQTAQQRVQDIQSRRSLMRQTRVQRASMEQAGAAAGTTGSSALAGGMSSQATQVGASLANMSGQVNTVEALSRGNQQIANLDFLASESARRLQANQKMWGDIMAGVGLGMSIWGA